MGQKPGEGQCGGVLERLEQPGSLRVFETQTVFVFFAGHGIPRYWAPSPQFIGGRGGWIEPVRVLLAEGGGAGVGDFFRGHIPHMGGK